MLVSRGGGPWIKQKLTGGFPTKNVITLVVTRYTGKGDNHG